MPRNPVACLSSNLLLFNVIKDFMQTCLHQHIPTRVWTMEGGVTAQTDIISEVQNLGDDIENAFSSIGQRPEPRSDLIYGVPSDMAEMAKKQPHVFEKEMPVNVFSPCIVSIGPLNFNPSSSSSMGNEIKKEALRKMLEDHAHVTNQTPGSVKHLIRRIEAHEEEIKECYADRAKIPDCLSGSTFAGIMLLDSCFLLQLLDWVSDKQHSSCWNKEKYPLLARVFEDRHIKAMVLQDIFKIGNQIPLFVVQTVANEFQISSFRSQVKKTLLRICPLSFGDSYAELFTQVDSACDTEKPHLLSLLHRFLCSSSTTRWCYASASPKEYIREIIVDSLQAIIAVSFALFGAFCPAPCHLLICNNGTESNQSSNVLCRVSLILLRWIVKLSLILLRWIVKCVIGVTYLLSLLGVFALSFVLGITIAILGSGLLLPFLIIAYVWPRGRIKHGEPSCNMARAENLAPHISIKAYSGGINGIQFSSKDDLSLSLSLIDNGIEFPSNYGPSLYLPRIKVRESSRVILHNVIAMEQRLAKKTVCNYVLLMGNLLQTPEDVAVLEDRQVLASEIKHLRPKKLSIRRLLTSPHLYKLSSRQLLTSPQLYKLSIRQLLTSLQQNKDRNWTVRMFQGLQVSAAAAAAQLEWWDWTDCCIKTLRQLQEDIPEPSWLAGLGISVQFWIKDLGRRYAASPWMALSTAAAAILLFMTAAQVVCLFVNCSSRSRSSPHP